MRLVTAEWHDALGSYPTHRLHAALNEHIRRSTFWPTIAEFVEILREETPPPDLKLFKSEPKQFAREGRTEAEEIAHRAAQCLRWKQSERAKQPEIEDPADAKPEAKPASQAAYVSFALYHSCHARHARGEQTCEEGCFKPKPGVRNCRIDRGHFIEGGNDDLDVATPDARA